MDGLETKDELDRAKLFDIIANHGPKCLDEICRFARMRSDKVTRLTSHPWFTTVNGRLRIAKSPATTKTALKGTP